MRRLVAVLNYYMFFMNQSPPTQFHPCLLRRREDLCVLIERFDVRLIRTPRLHTLCLLCRLRMHSHPARTRPDHGIWDILRATANCISSAWRSGRFKRQAVVHRCGLFLHHERDVVRLEVDVQINRLPGAHADCLLLMPFL